MNRGAKSGRAKEKEDSSSSQTPRLWCINAGYGCWKADNKKGKVQNACFILYHRRQWQQQQQGAITMGSDMTSWLEYASVCQALMLREGGSDTKLMILVDLGGMINDDSFDQAIAGESVGHQSTVSKPLCRLLEKLLPTNCMLCAFGSLCQLLLKLVPVNNQQESVGDHRLGSDAVRRIVMVHPQLTSSFVNANLASQTSSFARNIDVRVVFASEIERDRRLAIFQHSFPKVVATVSLGGSTPVSSRLVALCALGGSLTEELLTEEPEIDLEYTSDLGESLFYSELTVVMNKHSKQYEQIVVDVTRSVAASLDEALKQKKRVDHSADGRRDCQDQEQASGSEEEIKAPRTGALILRGNRCVLVRSLTGAWRGMRVPAVVPGPAEAPLDAAMRAIAELCEIDVADEVYALDTVPPFCIYSLSGTVTVFVMYAVERPPDGPLENADQEDWEDLYDWYTFPRALRALRRTNDEATISSLRCVAWCLYGAARASGIPVKWGGYFGMEMTEATVNASKATGSALEAGSTKTVPLIVGDSGGNEVVTDTKDDDERDEASIVPLVLIFGQYGVGKSLVVQRLLEGLSETGRRTTAFTNSGSTTIGLDASELDRRLTEAGHSELVQVEELGAGAADACSCRDCSKVLDGSLSTALKLVNGGDSDAPGAVLHAGTGTGTGTTSDEVSNTTSSLASSSSSSSAAAARARMGGARGMSDAQGSAGCEADEYPDCVLLEASGSGRPCVLMASLLRCGMHGVGFASESGSGSGSASSLIPTGSGVQLNTIVTVVDALDTASWIDHMGAVGAAGAALEQEDEELVHLRDLLQCSNVVVVTNASRLKRLEACSSACPCRRATNTDNHTDVGAVRDFIRSRARSTLPSDASVGVGNSPVIVDLESVTVQELVQLVLNAGLGSRGDSAQPFCTIEKCLLGRPIAVSVRGSGSAGSDPDPVGVNAAATPGPRRQCIRIRQVVYRTSQPGGPFHPELLARALQLLSGGGAGPGAGAGDRRRVRRRGGVLVAAKGCTWLAGRPDEQCLLSFHRSVLKSACTCSCSSSSPSTSLPPPPSPTSGATPEPVTHITSTTTLTTTVVVREGPVWWAAVPRGDWPVGLDTAIAPLWKEPFGDRQQELLLAIGPAPVIQASSSSSSSSSRDDGADNDDDIEAFVRAMLDLAVLGHDIFAQDDLRPWPHAMTRAGPARAHVGTVLGAEGEKEGKVESDRRGPEKFQSLVVERLERMEAMVMIHTRRVDGFHGQAAADADADAKRGRDQEDSTSTLHLQLKFWDE